MNQIFEDKLIPLFRELIQNACVNDGTRDSGQESKSVETLQRFFSQYGLVTEVFTMVPGRGNLMIRIPGTQAGAPSLMLMGHMDVVPANAQDWKQPPFSAEIKDGEIWGRGAVDMLCWTAAQAVGFAEALKNQGPFPGDLIYLALADEEASGRYGARFLVENHWDRVRCDYMVTELGGFFIETDQGPGACVNLGEKGIAWLKIQVKGIPGHGSMPYMSQNAVVKAAAILSRLARYSSPLKPHALYRRMAQAMARGPWQRWRLISGRGEKGALEELYRRDPGMAKFLHTAGRLTISPNAVTAGSKVNIIADRAEMLVDIRFLPGETKESITKLIRSILGPYAPECTFEFVDWFDSNVSPEDTPLMKATEKILKEHHPDSNLVPIFIGGVTDGRYWRTKGTTVYGFTLFEKDLTMDAYGSRIHGIDERISLVSLQKGLEYFTALPGEFFRSWAASLKEDKK